MPPMGGRGARGFLSDEEKASMPTVTPALLKRVFSWLKPYRLQFILTLVIIGLSAILDLYPSILTGRIVDEGLINRDMPLLVKLIIVSFILKVASNLLGILQNYLNAWIAQHITFDMRNQLFKHLLQMSYRFFTENNQGEILTRMNDDTAGVQSVITNTFASILSNTITLVAAIIIMLRRNVFLTILAVIVVPLFTLPTRSAGKRRWSLTKQSQECQDGLNSILEETLSVSGQLLVKLFTKEDEEYDRYVELNKNMVDLNIKESMAGRWFRAVIDTLSSFGPMLIYLAGGILMIKYNQDLSVGDITVMVSLLSRMYGPVNSLLSIGVEWIRSLALFDRIFEYLDMDIEVKEAENPIIPSSIKGEVSFEHVNFHYNEEREILKDINFDLDQGHSIALVGPSGSGKSTVVSLIPRLYDVISGSVKFDGVDVKDLDLEWLRDQIGLVSQETYLFSGTIKENLLYAKPDATQEEIEEACKKAYIHDFITEQQDGYETMVGNRGLKLSGGEKQRLSIARVLLKNPALLIFDEATSALDTINEDLIQKAIEPLIESRTSILIAHRLSTVLAADEILVVKDGSIVERGTHSELLKNEDGVYHMLYEKQFKSVSEEE